MKKIEAIIKPFKLDSVHSALNDLGIQGMTITNVREYGRQTGQFEVFWDPDNKSNLVSKIKIEIVVNEDIVPKAIEAILHAAKTGVAGDGKIFISSLSEVIRIRTGEKGAAAV